MNVCLYTFIFTMTSTSEFDLDPTTLKDRSIFIGDLGPVQFKILVWKKCLFPILRENKQKLLYPYIVEVGRKFKFNDYFFLEKYCVLSLFAPVPTPNKYWQVPEATYPAMGALVTKSTSLCFVIQCIKCNSMHHYSFRRQPKGLNFWFINIKVRNIFVLCAMFKKL